MPDVPSLPVDLPPLNDDVSSLLASLERYPDVQAPNLYASDQADTLALRFLSEAQIHGMAGHRQVSKTVPLLVLNDSYGAISLGAIALGFENVLVFQDRLSWSQAILNNGQRLLPNQTQKLQQLSMEELVSLENVSPSVIVMKLPRGLEELEWVAWVVSRYFRQALLVAVGLQKYMTPSQTELLKRFFAKVQPSRGFGKARALIATNPLPDGAAEEPVSQATHRIDVLPNKSLELFGVSATYGSSRIDPGSRFLIDSLAANIRVSETERLLDLGCGNGTLAVSMALLSPSAHIAAVDQSASAVRATRVSAMLNGVEDRVSVRQLDGTDGIPDSSVHQVVLNPPFHTGHAVDPAIAHKLFEHASRVLVPGGKLWVVFNSFLRYQPVLKRIVGPTRQVSRNKKFTVTVSERVSH